MTCSSLQSPQEFCVKLVKPQFIRSLAREAWFYEQLAELQGVAVPRCFGFFVAPLPDGVSWIDAWGEFRDEDEDEEEETSNESHSKDRQEKNLTAIQTCWMMIVRNLLFEQMIASPNLRLGGTIGVIRLNLPWLAFYS